VKSFLKITAAVFCGIMLAAWLIMFFLTNSINQSFRNSKAAEFKKIREEQALQAEGRRADLWVQDPENQ
jgi:hypothetical protein